MNRNEFLKSLGAGTVAVCVGCTLESCSKESITPADFTIDITAPANAALQTVGGSLIKSPVIIARTTAYDFVAMAMSCTHEGTTVSYQHANGRFHCANHGANFSLTGSVLNGPASQALHQYNTELTGSILHVFS
jgi:cytochrome b6-f complex iron-sulfur subunit